MDGAGPDDDEDAVVVPGEDPRGGEARDGDGALGGGGGAEFVSEEGGLDEGVVLLRAY